MLVSKTRDESLTAYLDSILEIDLKKPRCVVNGFFEIYDHKQYGNHEDLNHIVDRRLNHYTNSFYTVSNQMVTIIMEKLESTQLTFLLEALAKDITDRYHTPFVFGIGSCVDDYKGLAASSEEAKIAASWAKQDM